MPAKHNVAKAMLDLEALRESSQLKRLPLSVTLHDLVEFCNGNFKNDFFLNPTEENPFKVIRKPLCSMI